MGGAARIFQNIFRELHLIFCGAPDKIGPESWRLFPVSLGKEQVAVSIGMFLQEERIFLKKGGACRK